MCVARELSTSLRDTVISIRKTAEELNQQLSQIDKIINDLKHEIEFNKYDVFRGFNKFIELQNALRQRRIIKNEWELIQPLIDYTGNIEKNIDKVHTEVVNKELSYQNRKYKPRVLKSVVNS